MDKPTEMIARHVITRREALTRVAYLLGGSLSASTIAGVLAGCERRAGPLAEGAGALSAEQKELVATLAEHIIPETDTPGARATGVPDFIEVMLTEYYPPEERALFVAGLAEVDERAERAHGSRFLECAPDEQLALLTELDRETFAPRPQRQPEQPDWDVREEIAGAGETPLPPELEADSIRWIWGEPAAERAERPFWRTLKELTLVGYYTSEPGATQELRYEAVPGRYEGCIPFSQIGRTWAV